MTNCKSLIGSQLHILVFVRTEMNMIYHEQESGGCQSPLSNFFIEWVKNKMAVEPKVQDHQYPIISNTVIKRQHTLTRNTILSHGVSHCAHGNIRTTNFSRFCIRYELRGWNSANSSTVHSLVSEPACEIMIVCMYVMKSKIKIILCITIQ